MRILVVEDDQLTAQTLVTVLTQQNYAVEVAADGELGWNLVEAGAFDLILLDVMIPKLDGIALCRRLRSHHFQMPILLLTGKDSSHDKAIGLDAGADDYVVKPFDSEELVARVRALLRRGTVTSQPLLEWGSLRLDPSTCQVTNGETPISLTPKEYALLELFLRNGQRVFSCGAILEHLWTFDDTPGEEAVRTHIKGLRQKLKAASVPGDLVETVYGIGYRLKPFQNKATSSAKSTNGQRPPSKQVSNETPETKDAPSATGSSHPSYEQTRAAIALVWERLKPRVDEQLHTLEQAAIALANRQPDTDLHQQARREAHSLSGSLGTFGFGKGSNLARQIESALQKEALDSTEITHLQSLISALKQEITPSPSSPTPPSPLPSPPPPSLKTASVMAVDDDPQILEVLQTLLQPWGLKVTTLSDPRQFWQMLEQTNPDLLILDLEMPHHSGFELCQALRENDRWSSLPVMVLTAHMDADTVNWVFTVGVDDFVPKPIVGPELVTRIVNRLERVRLQQRLGTIQSEKPPYNISVCQEDRFFNLSIDLLCVIGLEGYFKRLNPAATQILGYSIEELMAQPLINFVHPDDRALTLTELQKLPGGASSLDFENRYRCQDGSYKWLSWRSVPALEEDVIYAIARDITPRKQREAAWQKTRDEIELRVAERTAELVSLTQQLQQELDTARRLESERNQAERELRISQARFAGILEIADDAIISINGDQCITLFNQGAEKIFGYTAAEVIGQPLDILLPQRAVHAHRKHVVDFGLASGQARRMGERSSIFGRRKDGSEFPAEASISRLDQGGEKVFTVILRDITERQKIDRMKNEFVSVVSHELRTPLTSIHGSLGMLASGLLSADSERGKRLLQIAVDSTDRLVRLINDILDIERIESGKVSMVMLPCNVANLVSEAIDEVQSLADKAEIHLSVASVSAEVVADGDRVIQTLTNLLSNAIKFSNSGSTVCLKAEAIGGVGRQVGQMSSSPSPSSTPSTLSPSPPSPPHILFTVQDQGRGIPADKLESIFERFQQVDASDSRHQDGTGLGLTICRSIVQQHGGEIWVESRVGAGSTFYFTLPFHPDQHQGLDRME
jgi:PAS domain S-box-containing protein